MRWILPFILVFLGLAIGGGAGFFLRPEKEEHATDASDPQGAAAETTSAKAHDPENPPEYVKMTNQFVVPVVKEGRVESLVLLSLSLEVTTGQTELVYAREPKLRDEFLQMFFDYANTGGFDGSFTDTDKMSALRRGLLGAARNVLGPVVTDVLITEIIRQDA